MALIPMIVPAAERPKTVNREAVDLVEGLLARLQSGESVAVALVEVNADHETVATAFSKFTAYHQLCSGAARLAARLAND